MCTSNNADTDSKALLLLNNLLFTLLTVLCPGAVVGEDIKIVTVIIIISQTYPTDSLKMLHLNIGNVQRKRKTIIKKYILLLFT